MRNIITLLVLVLACSTLQATNYYLSNTGDDNANGNTPATAWETITQLNTVTYFPGDSVFLQAGDVFTGSIDVNESGDPTGGIVFMAYGNGAAPIISGSVPVTGWTVSGNHYEADITQIVRNFVVNGRLEDIARYPNNNQYLWLDSATTDYLLDADMPTLDSNMFKSSKICIHSKQWCWEKSYVPALDLDTIKLSIPLELKPEDGYGYFLFDNVNHLDTAREWTYHLSTRKLHYFPEAGVDPNTLDCQASIYNYGIQLGNDVCYVTIEGIDFERQGILGVNIPDDGSWYNNIRNCHFLQQGQIGIQDKGAFNTILENNFREIGGIAVYLLQTAGNTEIAHNTFQNIGPARNGGYAKQINLSAITLDRVDSCHVHHNDIDSTGYCGISADGNDHIVERNFIQNAMLLNNDGAAIKSEGLLTFRNTFRNNFVKGCDGNTEGTHNASFLTPGIYFDDDVSNSVIQNNTIWNHMERGILQNPGTQDNEVRGNVVFGGSSLLELNGGEAQPSTISGINVKGNTFFALDPSTYLVRQIDYSAQYQAGDIDSNYCIQPYSSNYAIRLDSAFTTSMNFADWQTTGNDVHSTPPFFAWTAPQNDARLFMNMTDVASQISLQDTFYLDLDSNLICGSVLLEPYTSRVLINTGDECTISNGATANSVLLRAFPNPAKDHLFIQVDAKTVGELYTLINLQGQVLRRGKLNRKLTELNLDGLSKGMYFLRITAREGATVPVVIH